SQAPNSASLLWDKDLGTTEIVSTPSNAYGMLYVETFQGLFALDDSSGAVRWHNPLVKGFSSPAVFDGSVITGASDGRVYRVDAFDGSEVWNTSLIADAATDGNLHALRNANGTEMWRTAVGAGVSSPALYRDTVFVGGGDLLGSGRVTAVNRVSGAALWTFIPNGPVQSSVTYAD